MNPFYDINLPVDGPLNITVDELYERANFIHTGMALMPIDYLNPKLVDILVRSNIKLKDFVCWNWDKKIEYRVHTDGNYFSDKKRLCGMNWNFTEGTSVKFFSTETGEPVFRKSSEIDFSTYWVFENKSAVSEWSSAGPVIINTQVPHQISFNVDGVNFRRSITLRFQETFETLYFKLKNKNYV